MCTVRFIADTHFHHEKMIKNWRPGFSSMKEHNELIVSNWNSTVRKRDLTYILGDITMESSDYNILDRLNGRKIVVMGNHDLAKHSVKLLDHVDYVAGIIRYKKGIFITHVPVHPMEFDYRIKYNIHGHLHDKIVMREEINEIPVTTIYGNTYNEINIESIPDERYVCVSCEQVDYTPKTLEELQIKL